MTAHPSTLLHDAKHTVNINLSKDNKANAHTRPTINSSSRIKAQPVIHDKTPIMPTLADIAFSPTSTRHNEDWDDVLAADPAEIALELDDTSHSQPNVHEHSGKDLHADNVQKAESAVQYIDKNAVST